MKILCIGQSAYDITLPLDGYPIENKKYKIKKSVECGGGSCNNSAYLLAKWGMDVYLASSIGNDLYGKKIKEELKKAGVNIDYCEELDNVNTTVSYIINNTETGTRTIITNRSPLMHFTNLKDIDVEPDIILLDGNDYDMSLKVLMKNKNSIKIIDAGSYKEETVKLSQYCDYIVCSNDFARDYTKIDFDYNDKIKLKEVYDTIQKDFRGKLVITLESFGSMVKIDEQYYIVPSVKVKSIDSTGAGDIYHGAFTYFIANNYSLLETLHYANIAGALSVTKIGSKTSMPTKEEVLKYHEL